MGLLIKEAKEEIWKKWRQNKGRKNTNPKTLTKEDKNPIEDKLKRVELEVAKFKEERDKKIREEEKQRHRDQPEDEGLMKQRRLATKKRLEGYWGKLRWITKILEETEDLQADIKKLKQKDAKEEEEQKSWNMMTNEEKKETISEEDALEGKRKILEEEGNTMREERLEEAVRMKRTWKQGDDKDSVEDVEEEDFLGQESPRKFCFTCCMTMCICIVRELDRKLEMLKIQKEVEALEAKLRTLGRQEQEQGRKDKKRRRLDDEN